MKTLLTSQMFGSTRALSVRTGASAWILLATTLLSCPVLAQSGGGFDTDWFSIDGGGSLSTGGGFAVSGTIGQPEAGAMAGGVFTLIGGFWSVEENLHIAMPTLHITRSGANVLISWVPATPGFVLQGNAGLFVEGWSDAPSGGTNPVSVPASGAARFYRLRKP